MTQPSGGVTARFIRNLLALGEERAGGREPGRRASLAELRRGLGRMPGESPRAYGEVLALLGEMSAGPRFEDACFQIATLYALYPQNRGAREAGQPGHRLNLGGSLRLLGGKEHRKQGAERRVTALLNCHGDELGDHLRHAVSLLKADDLPIDWGQLLEDRLRWADDDRHVQRAWARAFWGFSGETAAGLPQPSTA